MTDTDQDAININIQFLQISQQRISEIWGLYCRLDVIISPGYPCKNPFGGKLQRTPYTGQTTSVDNMFCCLH